MTLDDEDVEAIAVRIVEMLNRPPGMRGRRLATANEVADALGVGRSWVYAHQTQLRAIRLGSGPKSRLRFDLERATEAFRGEGEGSPPEKDRARLRSRASTLPAGVELIRGRSQR